MPNLLQYDENCEKKHLPNLLSKFTKCQFQTRHLLIQFICFLFPLPFVELFSLILNTVTRKETVATEVNSINFLVN